MSSPDVTLLEEQSLVDAIRSGWIAPLGPDVNAFEAEVAEYVGTSYGVALNSGTSALHLALLAWHIGLGDYIPTSTMTFAATANAISYTGATPVFVDSNPATGNIDPYLLDEAITSLKFDGKSVPAILPVDLLGKCADYTLLARIARKHNVKILSDSAESLGASHGNIAAGSFGDAAILSFNGNKVMTTSGGGMFLTKDKGLADRVRFLSTQAREPAIHYEHKEVGYNYRMSNLLAALGRAQLKRLDDMIGRRRAMRDLYANMFASVDGVEIFGRENDHKDNCWLTAVLIDQSVTGWAPARLFDALNEAEIESRPLWKPMHMQPIYADRPNFLNGVSETLFKTGMTLPSGSALTKHQICHIEETLNGFLASVK